MIVEVKNGIKKVTYMERNSLVFQNAEKMMSLMLQKV